MRENSPCLISQWFCVFIIFWLFLLSYWKIQYCFLQKKVFTFKMLFLDQFICDFCLVKGGGQKLISSGDKMCPSVLLLLFNSICYNVNTNLFSSDQFVNQHLPFKVCRFFKLLCFGLWSFSFQFIYLYLHQRKSTQCISVKDF